MRSSHTDTGASSVESSDVECISKNRILQHVCGTVMFRIEVMKVISSTHNPL